MRPAATVHRASSPAGRVTVLAPAKINLALEVGGRRSDGYHEVVTILQAIHLHDRVVLERWPGRQIDLVVRPRALDLGPPEKNLAVRAASILQPRLRGGRGVRIRLEKRIPAGGGLGGGSSDAAAVLVGLNRLCDLNLSPEQLERLGARLGSDVPFFVRGGTQLGTGRGDRLRPFPPWPGGPIVLAHPGRALSTAEVYRRFESRLTPTGPLLSIVTREVPRAFWLKGGDSLRNDLTGAVLEAEPAVRRVLERFRDLGASFARVTGSGACVFGVAPDREAAAAWVQAFRGAGCWATSVRPARGGCSIRR